MLTIVLTLIIIPLATSPTRAVNDIYPTPWAPYGPDSSGPTKLVMKYYDGDTAERNGFVAGEIDIMDSGQAGTGIPVSQYAAYEANQDWLITPGQPSAIWHGVQFNYASSTWAAWGCDFTFGNSACGVEIREAFAHLLDKVRTITDGPAQGSAVPISNDMPASKLNPNGTTFGTPAAGQCAWDSIAAHQVGCISAFNLSPDPGGTPVAGSPDFCAAVDHLIAATALSPALGLIRDPAAPLDSHGNRCGISAASPGIAGGAGPIPTHKMRAKVRTTNPRLTYGTNLAAAMDALFGGVSVTTIQIGTGGTFSPIVFSCCSPSFPTDDWDWYTEGFIDSGPYPTSAYPSLHSSFASDLCGGDVEIFPNNYAFICITSLDGYALSMVTQHDKTDIAGAYADAYAMFNVAGSHVTDIPVYSLKVRTAALREGTGWVNGVGVAYETGFNFLSAHRSAYNQVDPANRYHFGGGSADTVRWGMAGGEIVSTLNPYNAEWAWEFDTLLEIYDSLFNVNPTQPNQVFNFMTVTDNYQSSNYVDSNGNTHFFIQLRQNLRWQDDIGGSRASPVVGGAIDAYDVKFSLLTERDFAAVLSQNTALVLEVNILNPTSTPATLLEVVMQGKSIAHELNLGGTLIVPRHIWELSGDTSYGDVGTLDPALYDTSYDTVASGTYIGSSQFECRSIFPEDLGALGTGCTVNSDGTRGGQAMGGGASMHYTLFDNTGVPGNTDPYNQWIRNSNTGWGHGVGTAIQRGQFQEFSYADKDDSKIVDLPDVLSILACNGKTSAGGGANQCPDYAYWVRSDLHPGSSAVIGQEVAIAASHFDDTWIDPLTWDISTANIVAFSNGGLVPGP